MTIKEIEDIIDDLVNVSRASSTKLPITYRSGSGRTSISSTLGKRFEVYIMCLCKEAVENLGGSAEFVGIISGSGITSAVFRGAPGNLWSTSSDYSYIDCVLRGIEFEIHLNICGKGDSDAEHEMDVSIIEKRECIRSRNNSVPPKNNRSVVMIFECKYYSNSTPGIGLARGFSGLLLDFRAISVNGFISNDASSGMRKYFARQTIVDPILDYDILDTVKESRFVAFVEQGLLKWLGKHA